MTPWVETNKAPITTLKEMEIYELSNRIHNDSLKGILRKRQLNKIRKPVYKQNEKLDKKIATFNHQKKIHKNKNRNPVFKELEKYN